MVNDLKEKYNQILKRYYNGIKFVCENEENEQRYIIAVQELQIKLDEIIKQKQDMTEDEKLYGFNDELKELYKELW